MERTVSSMQKSPRVYAKCLNCGMIFSSDASEYFIRVQNSEQPGLFHSRTCMIEYRENHKTANGMKKRILELNKLGKQ